MVLGHDILTSERTQDIKITEDVSFDSMLLSPNTLKGLKASGFYVPSPIQLHGIPLGKCGLDLLLEAKSGTGKTAVFTVIALEKLNLDKGVQTLILAPTREIASQICDVIKTIGAYYEGLSVEVVMGGLSFVEDVAKFKKKVHIVVGSPGRLHHLIKHKHIDISSVRLMVLDEADKLVEKCFLPDINFIFSLLPSQKQIIMSSATYPGNIKTVIRNYIQNAHHICPDSNSVLLGIEQNVIVVPSHVNIVKQTKNRYDALNQILSKKEFKQCLVFCNYQVRVGEVHKMLVKDKWPTDQLHGQQQQTDRLCALKILQDYQCRILVSTDLAARGIDASNVDLVINFEVPYDWQTYLHRIGRAGRFGSYGRAINILCEGEENKLQKILGAVNIQFDLKYLWSKERFIIKEENENCLKKEDELKSEIKEPECKLGIKDTYEELWKMLSVEYTELEKETHNIPTFESLCNSFEQANRDSMIGIESFSDLLSSFQNHEIKSKDKSNYKPVEVNKLLIPCNIFNRNLVSQSFQKHKNNLSLEIPHAENNTYWKFNGSKLAREIDSKESLINICHSPSNTPKQVINENVNKLSNSENEETDSGSESIKNEEKYFNLKGQEHRFKSESHDFQTASRSSEYKTHTKNHDDLQTASGSSENKTQTKSKTNTKAGIYERFGKDQILNIGKLPKANVTNDQNFIDSDFSSNQSDENANDFITTEYNGDEKLLLAANLPIAFGKSKQRNITSGKCRDLGRKKCFNSNNEYKRNSEYQTPQQKTCTQSKTNQRKPESVYELSDSEKTEDDSVIPSYRSLGGKKYYFNNGTNNQNNDYTTYNLSKKAIEERECQFDIWYKQLKTKTQMIEKSVYIAEMNN